MMKQLDYLKDTNDGYGYTKREALKRVQWARNNGYANASMLPLRHENTSNIVRGRWIVVAEKLS